MTLPWPVGIGIGWRPELALAIDRRADLGFVEVIAESFDPRGSLPPPLDLLRRRGTTIIPHGLSLSLGSAEPIDSARLDALARLALRLDAPLVSEHIAFVRAGGRESGHLLPLPRTKEALDVLIANVRTACRALPVPLALENVASLFEWPGAEMDEADFLNGLLACTDALLLLDIENLYANVRNHGGDAQALIDRLPVERIAYVHVAGGVEREGLYHDTHAHSVPAAVLDLLGQVCKRRADLGVLLEWDANFPSDEELNGELDRLAAVMGRAGSKENCRA